MGVTASALFSAAAAFGLWAGHPAERPAERGLQEAESESPVSEPSVSEDVGDTGDAGRSGDKGGMWIDAERGCVALQGSVLVRDDLLEYLLIAPHGAAHESLFSTEVSATLWNAALLGLGVVEGQNASWEETGDEDDPYRIHVPRGEGAELLPYVAWKEDGETYFFRTEDLIVDLATGRSMRRHPWIFLGSRIAPPKRGEEPRFLAELTGNLVNLAFFFEGNTIVTAAHPACVSQTIWVGNAALLPPRGTPVLLIFARERLAALPAAWDALLIDSAAGGQAETETPGAR